MKVSGIYYIKNKLDNKVYIGSSKNIGGRLNVHKSKLRKSKHHSSHLQNSFNLNPDAFVFEILEIVEDINMLEKREQYWVDLYKAYDREFGFNMLRTVDRNDPERMRERWCKPGEIDKQRGRMLPINRDPERCRKVSEGLKAHMSIPENRDKKTELCPHRKTVQCVETKQIFKSINEASRVLGVSTVKIRDSFTGKRKSNGYSFRLING